MSLLEIRKRNLVSFQTLLFPAIYATSGKTPYSFRRHGVPRTEMKLEENAGISFMMQKTCQTEMALGHEKGGGDKK